jgi:predicted metal-binding membrane protein
LPPAALVAAQSRDRIVAAASLIALAVLAWIYLLMQTGVEPTPGAMGDMSMPEPSPGLAPHIPCFFMWSVMIVAMMLPGAIPAILLYARLVATNRAAGNVLPSTWTFTLGYLAVWTAFALAATVLQAFLEARDLLSPMLASADRWLTGGLLLLAGVYQWLPVKAACLDRCQTPLQAFLRNWRPGMLGAFRMGSGYGTFCVGCCWALMLLMFAAGVMNLLWVALITGFILVERLLSNGKLFGRLGGLVAGVVGVGVILAGN